MKKDFTDVSGNRIIIDSDKKELFLDYVVSEQPKFVFRNPKEMIEFATSINIIANRWFNSIPDELYDSFRLEKS